METMDDYKDELEASFRRINEGDIISGTVIDVNEEEVTLDLKYYAQGIIKVADLSNDPDFNVLEQVHKGDVIEATVVQKDDGAGNIVLSKHYRYTPVFPHEHEFLRFSVCMTELPTLRYRGSNTLCIPEISVSSHRIPLTV